MSDRLYIVGNGFDLFHQIPSSYGQFGRYVKSQDRSLADTAEDYLGAPAGESLWSRFEENLANLDVDQLVDAASMFLMSPGDDDWSDSANHDYQWQIRETVKALSSGLKAHFCEWLTTLPIPVAATYSGPRLGLDPAARYLSFNYTPTLSRLYGVADRRILHIHGKVGDDPERIVLGHAWEAEVRVRSELDADIDFRILEGEDIVDEYFKTTFKPAERILNAHKADFDGLAGVSEIFVLGHALSEVDGTYLTTIAEIAPDAVWRVSYYETPDEVAERIRALGVPWWRVTYQPLGQF